MGEIQQGEIALAMIGVSNVIEKKVPRWTLEKMREFDKIAETLAEQAAKCVGGDIELAPLPIDHDYYQALDRLSKPLPQEDIAATQDKFPQAFDQLSSEFIVTLQNTWNHLKTIFPISEYLEFSGPKNLLPTGDKTWRFFNKLRVLNNPLSVYMLISSGALLKEQAKAVQEFFPTLSQAITDSIYAAIEAKTLENPKFKMPERTKLGLNNWLGRRSVAYDPAPPPQVNPAATQKLNAGGGAEVSLSPTQKITDGGSAKNG